MTRSIPLTQGQSAIVDDADYERLAAHKWYCNAGGYAVRDVGSPPNRGRVFMHREIASTPDGLYTDHINGDRLDNRRANLRICTSAENMRNQKLRGDNASGFKGVYWRGDVGKWHVQIRLNRKSIHIGYFSELEKAALAYDGAAKKYHGEFARLNFNG